MAKNLFSHCHAPGSNNQIGSGRRQDIDNKNDLYLSLDANLGQNQNVNECGSRHQRRISDPSFETYQTNDLILNRGQPVLALIGGQLTLSHRLPELRRGLNIAPPPRPQATDAIDYFPVQTNPMSSLSEVSVTEVVRTTKFLTPTANVQHLLSQNNDATLLLGQIPRNDLGFRGQHNLARFHQASPPPFPRSHHRRNHTYDLGALNDVVLEPEPMSVYLPGGTRVHGSPSPNLGQNQNTIPAPSHEMNYRDLIASNKANKNRMRAFKGKAHHDPNNSGIESVSDTEIDGRTHSLPHKKYGPYTCPKCSRVFAISQTFAAHMLSHYRNETSEERRRRLLAKYRNRPTLLPMYLKDPMNMYAKRKKYVNIPENPARDLNNKNLENGESSRSGAACTARVVVKEEP